MNARTTMLPLLAASALALTACGTGSGSRATSPDPTPRTSVSPSTSAPSGPTSGGTPPSTADVAEFVDDYQAAVKATDDYWERHWDEFFTGSYRAPKLVEGGYPLPGIYDGRDQVATCAGEALQPGNAFYCPSDHSVAFDITLMLTAARQIGDSFVYMVVAHEWGHAIAAQVDRNQVSVAGELVADCLSGAAIYGSAAEGVLVLEEGDVKEIAGGLTAVADELPWGEPADHGDPFQRIGAFDKGRQQGPRACLGT